MRQLANMLGSGFLGHGVISFWISHLPRWWCATSVTLGAVLLAYAWYSMGYKHGREDSIIRYDLTK